jgi:hypothetical protein
LLVFRGTIPLSLVGELIGAIAIDLWSKVHDWVVLVRKEQSREHFCEWFQWLADWSPRGAAGIRATPGLVAAARMRKPNFHGIRFGEWRRSANKRQLNWPQERNSKRESTRRGNVPSNQSMKPTAPPRSTFSVFATTPSTSSRFPASLVRLRSR